MSLMADNTELRRGQSFPVNQNSWIRISLSRQMRMFLNPTPLSLLLLLFLATLVHAIDAEKEKNVQLDGVNISMFIVQHAASGQLREWPDETINVSTESVPVQGKTVHELLKANYIFPDVEAFSVVYALNPGIERLTRLDLPDLKLPSIRGGPRLEADFSNGDLILLTVDKVLKGQFTESVKRLTKLTNDIRKVAVAKFDDPGTRRSTINSLALISDRLNKIDQRIIQRYGRPVPAEVLRQLTGEAGLLNTTLGAIVSSQQRVTSAVQGQIEAVKRDVAIKARPFSEVAAGEAPARWPEVKVLVKTLREGREIPNLRIYYVPEALKQNADEFRSFGILSSPSDQVLPEADYCFWAAHDPSVTEVTNLQCREVRSDQQIEIQLTVIR